MRHPCTVCNKLFARKGTLKNHMQLHTGQFKYYCEQCRKGYSGLASYQCHMDKHKGIKYQCEYCPKKFTTTQFRDYHQSVHTGLYRFTCDICGKGFNKKRAHEQHSKFHTWLWYTDFFFLLGLLKQGRHGTGKTGNLVLTFSRQGKQGIWFLLFPDRENTGNFVVTQGKFLRHGENIFDCIN